MSHKHRSSIGAMAVMALFMFTALASPLAASAETEKKIPLEKVPAAARATLQKALQGGRIVDIGEIRRDGKVVRYEMECMIKGREVDVIVAPGGKLLATEPQGGEDEEDEKAVEVVPGKITPAAAAAVKKAYPKAKIKWIGVEGVGQIKIHKLILVIDGEEMELEIAPSGTLVSTQKDVTRKDMPKALRKALDEAIAGGKLIKIEREEIMAVVKGRKIVTLPKTKVYFEAKYSKDGMRHEVKLTDTSAGAVQGWRSTFKVNKKDLVSVGRNPYFILVPGHKIHLAGGGEKVIITVLNETKEIDGVETRVLEEREFEGGKLAEVSRNYFAIDKKTKDVYYFGEDVDDYDGKGKIAGHGGAWLAGVKGAKFGLIMPGKIVIGDKYYQEYAPNKAMDRAENVNLKATLKTPFKTFKNCLYIRESSDLEGGFSHKWYAAGIGMIGDDELRLVKVEPAKEAPDKTRQK